MRFPKSGLIAFLVSRMFQTVCLLRREYRFQELRLLHPSAFQNSGQVLPYKMGSTRFLAIPGSGE